jgi:hypothetical protein
MGTTKDGRKEMSKPKGLKKTGGRKKGTRNKATADIKALAQEYTAEAIRILASIMNDGDAPAAARVSAAVALLDRAHGKVPQGIGLPGADGAAATARRVIIELAHVA